MASKRFIGTDEICFRNEILINSGCDDRYKRFVASLDVMDPAEHHDENRDRALEELLATSHADGLRDRRLRGMVAREESTLSGVLVTLAEQRARVTIRTSSGWECRGSLTAVGTDVAVLRGDDFRSYSVRTSHISSVAPDRTSVPLAGNVTGDRQGSALSFESLLRDMHALDAAMHVVMDGDSRAGVASWVGIDLACIVAAGTGGPGHALATPCFVRLDAIVAVITE